MTTFVDLVREFFPEVSDEEATGILWEYTGFPHFWATGNPEADCRAQLAHLKDVGPQVVDAEYERAMGMVA